MKDSTNFITSYIIAIVITYLVSVFVTFKLNPAQWEEHGRLMSITLCAILGFLIAFMRKDFTPKQ